jgi:LysR family hydrogen peroxide-inducible transcriptional activator
MAIEHGLLENQNLIVIEPPGQQAHRDIGLVWRPSSSRRDLFLQLADVVSELL